MAPQSAGAAEESQRARTEAELIEPATTEPPMTEPPAAQPDVSAADRHWLRRYAQVQVRSGVFDDAQLHEMVGGAATSRIDDRTAADELARDSLAAEQSAWYAEAVQWVGRTDPERLDAALRRASDEGVLVVAAASDDAQIAAERQLHNSRSGTIVYTAAGVAAAVRDRWLTLDLRAPDGTPARRGDDLCALVEDALAEEGLLASAAGRDGELVVAMSWRRRLAGNVSDGAAAHDPGSQAG